MEITKINFRKKFIFGRITVDFGTSSYFKAVKLGVEGLAIVLEKGFWDQPR